MEPTETTMHAVRMHAYGGPDVLEYEEVPLPPAPTGNQVLVRVRAAGVGPWDGAVRRGEWRGRIDYPPLILGLDLSAGCMKTRTGRRLPQVRMVCSQPVSRLDPSWPA